MKLSSILSGILFFAGLISVEGQTVFTIGDSTMADRDVKSGTLERGWGQMLQNFFTEDIVVENHASCGRSTKSFIDEGRWLTVYNQLQPGDYVIIQFGHNDEKTDSTLHTIPGSSFDDNLRRFVRETREKGAIPVLMSPIVRRNFPPTPDTPHSYTYEKEGTVLVDTHGDYVSAMQRVAEEDSVTYIDMNRYTHDLVANLGPEKSKELYMWIPAGKFDYYPHGNVDNTHLNPKGSKVIASIAARELVKSIPALERYYCPQPDIITEFPADNINNPVLQGYFADPEIMYSEKTGKYYLYPTSDGIDNWDGYYFKAFSSEDLKNWEDEGVILDFHKDLSWADKNAWAPAIIEKRMSGGSYKYYYYFSADKKIGVAIADSPTGPFKDALDKPLIDYRLNGQVGGQQIDPDVFQDSVTGKYYLYWGCGYLAVAELNEDMTSLKSGTAKLITPPHFTEGTYVFYRNGKYYFLWSENDTRDENYRVRYAVSDSPTGPLNVPDDNIILAKIPEQGIYATGHNAVIQIPGTDEWRIVYHRFRRPDAINMGWAAGYHREVCIDRLEFNEDGSIRPIKPTL